MRRVLLTLLAASVVAAAGRAYALPGTPVVQSRTRVVHVSAVDAKGAAVNDLTAADFMVKEGGKDREVVKADPATAPIHVALIVDDGGSGIFRASIANFLNQMLGHGEFAIHSVTGQMRRLVDYTHEVALLRNALDQLAPGPSTPDGGQLLEGISDTVKDLITRKPPRSAIVVLTVGGDDQGSLQAHPVLDALRDSGAVLEVISVAESSIRSASKPARPADLLDGPLNLGQVLGDGPKQSGGHHDEIVASVGVIQALQRITNELLHQYAVTYVLPDGVKPDERLRITTKRKGVTLNAPSRIPIK